MPYKSQEQAREASRKSMERKRKGVNIEGLTSEGLTLDGTFFKEGVEYVPPLGTLPERPRYLTLSDGHVLDRANPPKSDITLLPGWKIEAMRRANEAQNMKPLRGDWQTAREVLESAIK